MPNPKRRNSKTRRDKRRSHDFLKRPMAATCENCDEVKLPHRACGECGHYKGREVIEARESF